jgi:O-antigen/teichoic acid export membrane protein
MRCGIYLKKLRWLMISAQLIQISGRLRGSAFLSKITKLVSGEVVAQIAAFAALPFLTRLYSPAAFGLLGVFMAVSEVGGKCASLRYDVALLLPQSDASAWALYRMTQRWALYFVLIILLFSYNLRWEISGYFGVKSIAPYFPIVALMVLAIGWQGLASYWSMRMQNFRALAEASAGSALIGSGFKLLVGVLGMGPAGLLWGSALQRWSNFLLIHWRTPRTIWLHAISPGDSQRQALQYREFPLYRLPQDVLNSFSRMQPNVLMVVYFGPLVAGFYILADRIIQLPFSLLQEAVRKVFYVKAVEFKRSGASLLPLCLKLSGLLLIAILPAVCCVMLWGPMSCALIFGPEWALAGDYTRWIMIGVLARFVSLPASVLIPVMGWNRFYLIFELLSTILRLATIVLVARTYSPQMTVMGIALSSAAVSLLLLGIVSSRLIYRDRKNQSL